jgi:hypothetical protein
MSSKEKFSEDARNALRQAEDYYQNSMFMSTLEKPSLLPMMFVQKGKEKKIIPARVFDAKMSLQANLFVCLREHEKKLLGDEYMESGQEDVVINYQASTEEDQQSLAIDVVQVQSYEFSNLNSKNTTTSEPSFTTNSATTTAATIQQPFDCPESLKNRVRVHYRSTNTAETSSNIPRSSIMYLCSSVPRLVDNIALTYSMWLGKRLQLPVMVVMLVSIDLFPISSSQTLPVAGIFQLSALESFGRILQSKFGIPVLVASYSGFDHYRATMKKFIQSYKTHTVVVDNGVNSIARLWPPSVDELSKWCCQATVIDVYDSMLVEPSTVLPSNMTLRQFDGSIITAAANQWRKTNDLYTILGIGIGHVPPTDKTLYQPNIQKILLGNELHDKKELIISVPSELMNEESQVVLLDLEDLSDASRNVSSCTSSSSATTPSTNTPITTFNSIVDGSESSALLAVSHLIQSNPANCAEMKNLEINPSQIGQEQLMSYLHVGSLSPRVLVDLVLGFRTNHKQEPYEWFKWIVSLNRRKTYGMGKLSTFQNSSSKFLTENIIFHSVSKREYVFFLLNQRILKDINTSTLHFPSFSMSLWQILLSNGELKNKCCVRDGNIGTEDVPALSLSNRSYCYPGSLKDACTNDSAFNCLQNRLRHSGFIHSELLSPWIYRLQRLLTASASSSITNGSTGISESFVTFDFILKMLYRYMLGASNDFNIVLGYVITSMKNTYNEQQQQHFRTESERVGRPFWDTLRNIYNN